MKKFAYLLLLPSDNISHCPKKVNYKIITKLYILCFLKAVKIFHKTNVHFTNDCICALHSKDKILFVRAFNVGNKIY